ncbi:bifunctional methylenetetrahydrofolate dehydrogenase/methenyltetrahydrofolate cyclohydrolase FolD [Fusobacterium perfoetens]|uniref:bifunctional methylenetetrahydrofolate dehydrogenase/methenyltetrahydrofolate cyclohydrolase FolD n=1 Tax=Fusobacterium perfoetens TaxID=852 RepID=UPI001F1B2528|nr:bifunctional methylenetetrahydrofolate dehydrogenase/methenyltetrahydrofolate cyclohydrolase FolD [Fusobacterium perfoetens]MCF2624723.1 bifunctional methylenetetrahydrofolate dehydrogenase/methenyltetrahydrofolate cyclohydrolase FolD [Fusobacterium perfoetens]
MIIDGKKCSEEILENLKKEVSEYKERIGKIPGLAVIILGDNPASKIYVRSKIRACEKVGIYSKEIVLSDKISEAELIKEIEKLNSDKDINGILVQLPLPEHINEKKICDAISIRKDVDGFKQESLGKIVLGDEDGFISCTPQGIIYLIDQLNMDLNGKNAVVVGRSNIVGKPTASLLINKGATTTVCNSKTKDLTGILKRADIIVVAVGKAGFLKKDMVKEGAVVIDVGINREGGKICGDVDFEGVSQIASHITPVPGGVGPMTIAMLLKNTVKAFCKEELVNGK